MLNPADAYFMQQEEPVRGCLLFLRAHILKFGPHITEKWSYGMPFFEYGGQRFCYLWIHKKYKLPYIGFVDGHRLDHPFLLQEKRTRMKILLIDPKSDIPLNEVHLLLEQALSLK